MDEILSFNPDVKNPMETFPWFEELTVYEMIRKWPTSYSFTPDYKIMSNNSQQVITNESSKAEEDSKSSIHSPTS
ncbi:hypothetical protein Y032_0199g1648 [Ancylostoma ceylanicum]|uniref:Uncharacterized protein n=1 Tax=Ancylostoma ceylanicum TaxID=53326 RepID=A0A016SMZ4_9BILA|nr:hypothetical protein Y032_0199g1648 [Ancylostoma ceylanicum]